MVSFMLKLHVLLDPEDVHLSESRPGRYGERTSV